MTNNNPDSDPDFCFPSSSSSSIPLPLHHHQKMRKKRTKLIKIDPAISPTMVSKPKYYSKKPDPCAPKITRPCTECGRKFWSWKALFGHMRCHPERQWRGINPPPNYRKPPLSPIKQMGTNVEDAALKMSAEDHEVAACLLLLSSSDHIGSTLLESKCGGDGGGGVTATCSSFHVEKDQSNCRFECSSCKKVFGSHQALGGHRASHKNVKGCFAITKTGSDGCEIGEEDNSEIVCDVKENVDGNGNNSNNNKMLKVLGHKCTTCLKVFSSGQALGGHKRCHWEKDEEASSNAFVSKENCGLDLNLLPPFEDESSSSSFSLGLTLDLRLGL